MFPDAVRVLRAAGEEGGPRAPRPSRSATWSAVNLDVLGGVAGILDRMTSSFFDQLADSVLDGKPATEDDALAVLRAHDDELLDVVAAAGRLRREHFGNTVKVNYLVNLKSGLCPENCNYCSQALGSTADILKYKWLDHRRGARAGGRRPAGGATRVCMVSSGRGPTNKDVERVADMVGVDQVRAPRGRDLRVPRACSRTARPSGSARPASTPTTTTSTPPSRTTTRSSRRTRTPTASTPSRRPRPPACRRAAA